MKLSTYIERLVERGWRREAAEEAAILAKEAGATWDPEEPELPQRVEVRRHGPDASRLFLGSYHETDSMEVREALTREAAARYNAMPGIFAVLRTAKEEAWSEGDHRFAAFAEDLLAAAERELQEQRERLEPPF